MLLLLLSATVRLTLNRPAVMALAEPEAVRLSVVEGRATLTPVVVGEEGAMNLFDRDRGGRGCLVPADAAQRLAEALGLSLSRPYMLLHGPSSDGDFTLTHHDRDGVPARHLAAGRLWLAPAGHGDGKSESDFADVDRDDADLPFGALVRRADAVIRRTSHQIGRPSTEVVEARRVMAAFDRLVRDVRPELFVDRAALETELEAAMVALDRGIARLRAEAK